MPDIARKQCKLMGHTFAQPITPEEVAGDQVERLADGRYRTIHMIMCGQSGNVKIIEFADHHRPYTRRAVATGLCHWDREQARRHLRALRYIMARSIKYAQ